MAGYSDYSMSNNAVDAYARGLRPASKIPGVPAALVRQYCRPDEWHHTSARYNETNFYDVAEVRAVFGLEKSNQYDPDPAAIAALKAHKAHNKAKKAEEVLTNCEVTWLSWSGSARNPKATEHRASGCTVQLRGNTATVILPSGKSFRKRLTTRGFSYVPAVV
jgi:hypothetical protein